MQPAPSIVASVGLDVSKALLDAVLRPHNNTEQRRLPHKRVGNNPDGFTALLKWACNKATCEPPNLRIVIEATGCYHTAAATALHALGCQVVIANPRRVYEYGKGIGKHSKSDKVDAAILARYPDSANLHPWEPTPPELIELRTILARHRTITLDIRREHGRDEVQQHTPECPTVTASLERTHEFHLQERATLEAALDDFYLRHPNRHAEHKLLTTITGIGSLAASHLLCLLRSRHFTSARQAAAFTGVVPLHKNSGTSIHHPPRISPRCDHRLRSFLYMPAIVARTHDPHFKAIYQRLIQRGKHPDQATIAIIRRFIHIAYGILKHRTPYNREHVAPRPLLAADMARYPHRRE